jgi:hypothetical protein
MDHNVRVSVSQISFETINDLLLNLKVTPLDMGPNVLCEGSYQHGGRSNSGLPALLNSETEYFV